MARRCCYFPALLLCLILLRTIVARWHMYNSSITPKDLPTSCTKYYNSTDYLKPKLIEPGNAFGLWPGLIRARDVDDGETLFGFYDAISILYKHQHPENCSTAKFLISGGYASGYGSQVHVEGQGLSAALDSGRVFLRHPGPPTNLRHFFGWQTNTELCQRAGTTTLDCYYRPWSSCTLEDALGAERAGESGWGPLRDLNTYRPGKPSSLPLLPGQRRLLPHASPSPQHVPARRTRR